MAKTKVSWAKRKKAHNTMTAAHRDALRKKVLKVAANLNAGVETLNWSLAKGKDGESQIVNSKLQRTFTLKQDEVLQVAEMTEAVKKAQEERKAKLEEKPVEDTKPAEVVETPA